MLVPKNLLRKDIKGEDKAISDYGKRKKQIPKLKSIFSEIQNDERDHKRKLTKGLKEMPVKSAKQFRFMQAMAHGKKAKKGIGPSPEVAKEFLEKTPHATKSRFAKKGK